MIWLMRVVIAAPKPPNLGINMKFMHTFSTVPIKEIFIIDLCLLKIKIILLKMSAGNAKIIFNIAILNIFADCE